MAGNATDKDDDLPLTSPGGVVQSGGYLGPATSKGEPIGFGDVADLVVNTAKGIARGTGKMLKGDSQGVLEEHQRTVDENREISRKAAANHRRKTW